MSNLPLCLGVLKHRAHLLVKFFFTVDFCLCGAILNILTIPNFPEHVCPTACVGLPGLPPSEHK